MNRTKTSDLSPLAETIEVSEDIMQAAGDMHTDRDISDNTSDARNSKNLSYL